MRQHACSNLSLVHRFGIASSNNFVYVPPNRYFPSIQIKNESIFLPCCLDFDFPLAHLIFVLHKIQMALKVRVQPVSAAVRLELAIAILFAIT